MSFSGPRSLADATGESADDLARFDAVEMVEQQLPVAEGTLQRLRTVQRDIREEYLAANTDPWIIGYSGGKDSTLLTRLVFEMLLDLAPSDRTRPVHLLCNDTLVESPILMACIDRMHARLQAAADSLSLPVRVV